MTGLILALVAVMVCASGALAQQPTMEEIVKKWAERREGIKCVKYVTEEHTVYYQRAPVRNLPNHNGPLKYPGIHYEIKNSKTYIFDLATGRY